MDGVLDETLTVQQALNQWPLPRGVDRSVDSALQALCYFEGDEDRHKTEVFYVDTQWQYLHQMAQLMAQGQPIPEFITELYHRGESANHQVGYYSPTQALTHPIRKPLTAWQRLIAGMRRLLQT